MEIKIENGELRLKGSPSILDKIKSLLSEEEGQENDEADSSVDEELDYVIVRARDAGVFAGYLSDRDSDEVVLHDARRLWYWDGAASLSELAMKGVLKPENCKFPCPVKKITVLGVCEVIETTKKAKKSIQGVKEWSAATIS